MKRVLFLSIASMAIAGCGGGGGSSGGGSSPSSTISGKVADGYISGAVVYWDCNGNKILDTGEISVKSSSGGAFLIDAAPSTSCTLTALVPIGAVDEDNPNTKISSPYTLVSTKGNETFISPLSTLVVAHMEKNPGVLQADAESAVASLLGVSGSLNTDYIAVQSGDSIKKKGVAKIIATVLQANHIDGTPGVGMSNSYTQVQSLAPSLPGLDYSSNPAIDNFLNPLKGFLKPSEPAAFNAVTVYGVRPNSGLGLSESQLTALDAEVATASQKSKIRNGIIKFGEYSYNELVDLKTRLVAAGVIAGSENASVQLIRAQKIAQLDALSVYFTQNIKDKNSFYNQDIGANFQFLTSTSIAGIEAISGAVSMATNAPSIDLRKYRSRPLLKNAVKTVRQYHLGDVAMALLSGLNTAGGQLSAESRALINKLASSDGENLTQEDYLALTELAGSIIDIGKDSIKNSKLEKFANVFSGALVIYNGFNADCTTATSDCIYSGLELMESMSEWVGMPERVQGSLQWMRSTMDAYTAGKKYDAVTAGAVQVEQNKVVSDWDIRIAGVNKYWLLQELGVAGLGKLFEAYDPSIPCAANQTRKHGVCTNAGGYVVRNIVGTSSDSSISLFTGAGAGGLSNVNMAPNDANVAYGIANYSQGGATKVGVFFLNQPNGLWYLTEESSSFLAVNDLGQAIVVRTNAQTLPATSTYYFISKANDGTMYKLYLPVPSGAFSIIGLMKNGNIVGVQGANTIIFDKTMQPITTINTVYSGIGGDGLMFGVDSQQNKIVRFADGSQATLPCNVATGQTDLTKPSSGRNCSSIIAANSNGVVVGSYYNADGTRGVFKYSKAGFTEIPIASNYYGYGGASTNTAPPRPVGISDAGDVLLAPIYSDQYQQTCAGGPFVLTGSAITDLRTAYLPNGNCWNIQAGISGGGNIYMSSQAQGYAVFLQKN